MDFHAIYRRGLISHKEQSETCGVQTIENSFVCFLDPYLLATLWNVNGFSWNFLDMLYMQQERTVYVWLDCFPLRKRGAAEVWSCNDFCRCMINRNINKWIMYKHTIRSIPNRDISNYHLCSNLIIYCLFEIISKTLVSIISWHALLEEFVDNKIVMFPLCWKTSPFLTLSQELSSMHCMSFNDFVGRIHICFFHVPSNSCVPP